MSYLCDTPQNPKSDLTLVFAHGAGAPMDSDFMQALAGLVAERGVRVIRFEFPYMMQRRQTGKKRPPDRMPILLDAFAQVVDDADVGNIPDRDLAQSCKTCGTSVVICYI